MHGYRVLTAQDGAEAVEVFRREADRIGVVVLDATMPRMSGRQAFDAIRAVAPSVPVLFASGYPAGEFLPEQPYPNTAFLNKPYTPVELANEVRRLLDARGGTA
jgi:CheY-like chemotaxis protein